MPNSDPINSCLKRIETINNTSCHLIRFHLGNSCLKIATLEHISTSWLSSFHFAHLITVITKSHLITVITKSHLITVITKLSHINHPHLNAALY